MGNNTVGDDGGGRLSGGREGNRREERSSDSSQCGEGKQKRLESPSSSASTSKSSSFVSSPAAITPESLLLAAAVSASRKKEKAKRSAELKTPPHLPTRMQVASALTEGQDVENPQQTKLNQPVNMEEAREEAPEAQEDPLSQLPMLQTVFAGLSNGDGDDSNTNTAAGKQKNEDTDEDSENDKEVKLSRSNLKLLLRLLEREQQQQKTIETTNDEEAKAEEEEALLDSEQGAHTDLGRSKNQRSIKKSIFISAPQETSIGSMATMDEKDDSLSVTAREEVAKRIEEQASTSSLQQDTFAFFITAPFCSFPMMLALTVLVLEGSVFSLVLMNSFESESDTNPLGIPSGVSFQAIIGQFLALFLAVITQSDFSTALIYLHEGWHIDGLGSAFEASSRPKWISAIVLQFLFGALALATTFLLIVTTDDVVEILLNFAAIEFITLIDNVSFSLATYGFFGVAIHRESLYVIETKYSTNKGKNKLSSPKFRVLTFIGCYLILLVSWVVVYIDQLRGQYTPKTLRVQFQDDLLPELSAYSGFYRLEILWGKLDITRYRYSAVNGSGFIGYCLHERAWTFTIDGDNSCDQIVVQSSQSNSFDVTSTAESTWSVVVDQHTGTQYPMLDFSLVLGCRDDSDCGGEEHGFCNTDVDVCECYEGYSGDHCQTKDDDICRTLSIDEQFSGFRNSRDYAMRLDLLTDSDGKLVQVYHRPVYYHQDDTGVQLLVYMGYRWGLTHSLIGLPDLRNHTKEGLVQYITQEIDFQFAKHVEKVEFLSVPILFDSPEANQLPVRLSWSAILGDYKGRANEKLSIDSEWLCAICDNTANPCRNGNLCNSATGQCNCENGAEGTLCQKLPLRNGKCDSQFNTPNYDYDGGDCCKLTCVTKGKNICGRTETETIGGVEVGYPFCVDHSIIVHPCKNITDCWTKSFNSVELLSTIDRANTLLSSNGRILVVSEPSLDVVRAFDLEGPDWYQRGPALIGPPGTQFGNLISIATLPSAIFGRRVGKVPLLMAIGIQGSGTARVRVIHWEPDAIDWKAVGDDIDVCSEFRSTCDLKALDVARYGSRVTISVVRTDNIALVYRTSISTSEQETWALQFYMHRTSSTKFSATSVVGDGTAVAFSYGLNIAHHVLSDDLSFTNQGNFMNQSQQLGFYVADKLDFFPFVRGISGWMQNVRGNAQRNWPVRDGEDVEVMDVELSGDHEYLYILVKGAYGHDFIVRVVGLGQPGAPLLIGGLNFTSPNLIEDYGDYGISRWQFSSEANYFSVFSGVPNTTENQIVVFQDYDAIGASLDGTLSSYAISDSADLYIQGRRGVDRSGYERRSKCGSSHHLQVALRLDQSPKEVSWSLETYQVFRSEILPLQVLENCDGCYYDDALFGNGIVLQSICLPPETETCAFFRFQAAHGQKSGAGVVLFKNGDEIFSYAGDSTDPVDYHLGDGSLCEVDEVVCGTNESHIMVEANFDGRAQVISWDLFDEDGHPLLVREYQGSTYDYSESHSTQFFQACGPRDQQYEFVIRDRDRDGLCCNRGEGGFSLYVDHSRIYQRKGRRKFGKETIVFNSTHVIDDPKPVLVEIQFDANARRIAWLITDTPHLNLTTVNRTYIDGEIRFHYESFTKNQALTNRLHTQEVYLTVGKQYYFTIYDTRGDGLCCDDGEGYFNVYYGTEPGPTKMLIEGFDNFTAVSSLGPGLKLSYPNETRSVYVVVPFIFSIENVLDRPGVMDSNHTDCVNTTTILGCNLTEEGNVTSDGNIPIDGDIIVNKNSTLVENAVSGNITMEQNVSAVTNLSIGVDQDL